MTHRSLELLLAACVAVAGCGNSGGNGSGDAGNDGDGSVGDAAVNDGRPGDGANGNADARVPPGCVPGGVQCNNCLDDDNDGMIDGFDLECTGALDDDEGSFATGIPGDNQDDTFQDCFFDGNSGSGDDGCREHTCCILGAPDQAHCPIHPQQYDPAACTVTPDCVQHCVSLTPPGCDCFGCCTLCDPVTNVCVNVATNPAIAPDCDASNVADPTKCPRCVKNSECNNPCDPDQCILCPGQTPDDLPPTCNGQECPTGHTLCADGTACPAGEFCIQGCCIDGIP